MRYAVIGDVHGHAEALRALLSLLGFRIVEGAFRHPEGVVAVFVGDLIDGAPAQIEVLKIVRRMRDAGNAFVAMGNHEANAIGFATRTADGKGWLRKRSDKNKQQHRAFLAEVGEDGPRHREWVDWFRTLPATLDLGGIRVCHAWWDEALVEVVRANSDADGVMDRAFFEASFVKESAAHAALSGITKGLEVELPEGCSFKDHGGFVRDEARLRWWDENATTYRRAAIVPESLRERMPDLPLPAGLLLGNPSGVPVFLGHYHLGGRRRVQNRNTAVVDFAAGAHGGLTAYRWEGEPELRDSNLVSVGW